MNEVIYSYFLELALYFFIQRFDIIKKIVPLHPKLLAMYKSDAQYIFVALFIIAIFLLKSRKSVPCQIPCYLPTRMVSKNSSEMVLSGEQIDLEWIPVGCYRMDRLIGYLVRSNNIKWILVGCLLGAFSKWANMN